MSDVGFEQPRVKIDKLFPLSDTITEQREYGKSLKARPIEEVFRPLKERTDVDLLTIWERNYDGKTLDKPPEKSLEKYFDPNAKNRKYYSYDWFDNRDGIMKHYLVVEEDQVGENSNLCVLAVFDKSPSQVTFREDLKKRAIPYIYLERLYFVNKETRKAIELASPWWQLPVDKDDLLVNSKKRRIGFFPRDLNITGEMYEAIVKTNNIILTDTQSDQPWFFSSGAGEGKAPILPRWMAYSLAGAEATQKERDIIFPKGLIGKLLEGSMSQAQVELANYLIDQWRDDSLRFSMRDLKTRIAATGLPLETVEKIMGTLVNAQQAMVGKEIFEKTAILALIRLKRNALTATFRFLDLLKWQGFNLLPGISSSELRTQLHKILKFYDELYQGKLQDFRVEATFANGDQKESITTT